MQIEVRGSKTFIGQTDVSSWSEEERMEYIAALTAVAEERDGLQEVKELIESPAYKIAQAKEEAAKLAEERAAAKRRADGDLVWADMLKKHDRKKLARLDTKMGIVVIRCPTSEECQTANNIKELSGKEQEDAAAEWMKGVTLYPDAKTLGEMTKELVGLNAAISNATAQLVDALEDAKRPFG